MESFLLNRVHSHVEPRWIGSQSTIFSANIKEVDPFLTGGPSSIFLRSLGKLSMIKLESAYAAYRTEDPKNLVGDTLGKYSNAKVPAKACNHVDDDDDDEPPSVPTADDGVLTGNTVQNPCLNKGGRPLSSLSKYSSPSAFNLRTNGLASETNAILHLACVLAPISAGSPAPTYGMESVPMAVLAEGIFSASLSKRMVYKTASHPVVTILDRTATSSHAEGVHLSARRHSDAQGNTGAPRRHSRSRGEQRPLSPREDSREWVMAASIPCRWKDSRASGSRP
mmetsp:Transcript_33465/g.64420  ORF Transcript_33465/g.64420 Transcript_33465/m.64420 type:complete len:281 (-) Transcript_33465:1129-1971(-)